MTSLFNSRIVGTTRSGEWPWTCGCSQDPGGCRLVVVARTLLFLRPIVRRLRQRFEFKCELLLSVKVILSDWLLVLSFGYFLSVSPLDGISLIAPHVTSSLIGIDGHPRIVLNHTLFTTTLRASSQSCTCGLDSATMPPVPGRPRFQQPRRGQMFSTAVAALPPTIHQTLKCRTDSYFARD